MLFAGGSKLFVEMQLLKFELSVYKVATMTPMFTTIATNHPVAVIIPFAITSLLAYPVIYGVPTYRLYKSCTNKTLQILDHHHHP